jgi:hypothetical protein
VERRFLLDVVVGEGATVLELLAGEDQTLLVRGNALLVLNLGLDVVDGVRRLDLEGDLWKGAKGEFRWKEERKTQGTTNGLSGKRLDEDLHATAETKNKVERRLLLDVVVREGATVLELLAGEDQTLLVRGNALLVLNLGLDVVDGVGRLDLEGDLRKGMESSQQRKKKVGRRPERGQDRREAK